MSKKTKGEEDKNVNQQLQHPHQTTNQTLILKELNQTNQTLTSILQTLKSIEENVSPSNTNSVYMKQERCILSLKKFEGLMSSSSNSGGSNDDIRDNNNWNG